MIWAHGIGGPLGIHITLGGGIRLSRLLGKFFHVEASVRASTNLLCMKNRMGGNAGWEGIICLFSSRRQRACPAVSQGAADGDENFHIPQTLPDEQGSASVCLFGCRFSSHQPFCICICKQEIWRVTAVKIHAYDLPYTHCMQTWDVNFIGVKKLQAHVHRHAVKFPALLCVFWTSWASIHKELDGTAQKYFRVLHFFSHHFGFRSARHLVRAPAIKPFPMAFYHMVSCYSTVYLIALLC